MCRLALFCEDGQDGVGLTREMPMKILLTIAVLVASVGQVQAGFITSTVNPANGNTYYLLTENSWTASQTEAVSLGGNLVTINDKAENDWVYDTFSSFGGDTLSLWIGLNDADVEGTFTWISGDLFTADSYENFAGPEPNNFFGNEDYVHFYTSNYGNAWNDATNVGRDIPDPIHGVVEVTAPVPEPSSLALLATGAIGLIGYRRRKMKQAA